MVINLRKIVLSAHIWEANLDKAYHLKNTPIVLDFASKPLILTIPSKIDLLREIIATRAILKSSGLTSNFWSDALLHAIHINNRLPHHSLPNNITPYQALSKRKSNLLCVHAFGSLVCIQIPGIKNRKLDTSRVCH